MPSASLIIAVDIGGTFTDITLTDTATGRMTRAKTPSTPHDPSEAFLTGVHRRCRRRRPIPPMSAGCCTAPRSPPT